ncbi:glycosyltransferase family 2 protein [Pseudomonas sp. UBA2684]|uniref:glycosyltransferase family 2 protein n=1 Tax=Pseudomonas sp. UBA2684 TaxID=1947311 RepID=UPI000E8ADA09|nr:glycosyltransferase family 2 protein [Pseudomonas sp. UBA2684]HBX57096.1 glycosyltransferase family 2 protein [Pseudomonas sp.]|tara:strand:+ start:9020 stop:9949 length:930 start_codon:yes stop_codon:yes gene_type:complete
MDTTGDTADILISVVIPAYNYAKTLPRAVESVLTQLGADASAELLVIDDGSTDNTREVLERLQAEHIGRFRVIYKANGGPASVRNLGIEETRGRFLIFLDADDEMAADAISLLAQHITNNPHTRMVIGGHWSVFADGKRRLHEVKSLPADARSLVRGYLLDKSVTLSNGACAMHRDVFVPGGYPERFRNTEDIPVFAQVLARFPCTLLDQPLALIHKHDTSLRHNLTHARAAELELVDEVFAARRMPAELQDLKQAYTAQRCLSLFRTFYSSGDTAAASEFYRQALRADWTVIIRWSYTRKALRMWLRG